MAGRAGVPGAESGAWASRCELSGRPELTAPAQELLELGRGPHWRDALARFEALCAAGPQPGVHVATTVIAIAARNGESQSARAAFDWLLASGQAPTAHTYTALMRSCDWRGALRVLDEMQAAGVEPTAHTAAALLSLCARGGAEGATAAAPLLARLQGTLLQSPAEGGLLDAHLLACLLALFGRLRDPAGAQRVWRAALAATVAPDAHAHGAYLTALTRAGDAPTAARHFRALRRDDDAIAGAPFVAAAGLRALATCGASASELSDILECLEAEGAAPPPHCYAAVLGAHCRAADAAAALLLLRRMGANGICPPTLVCIHLAMAACARAGHWADADALLQQLRKRQLPEAGPAAFAPDVVSFSTAMLAAAVAGHPAIAERQWEELSVARVAPNDYTFTALIGAHAAAARTAASPPLRMLALRNALSVQRRMAEHGVPPSVHTYNALIDAADSACDFGRALALAGDMRAAGIPPNAATASLLAAVGQRGAKDVAAQQSRLAAVSAAAAALATVLIQRGLL